jgi:hypothetical protein
VESRIQNKSSNLVEYFKFEERRKEWKKREEKKKTKTPLGPLPSSLGPFLFSALAHLLILSPAGPKLLSPARPACCWRRLTGGWTPLTRVVSLLCRSIRQPFARGLRAPSLSTSASFGFCCNCLTHLSSHHHGKRTGRELVGDGRITADIATSLTSLVVVSRLPDRREHGDSIKSQPASYIIKRGAPASSLDPLYAWISR